jgi:hypothetical protein
MAGDILCRYPNIPIYLTALPADHPLLILMINLTLIRTKLNLISLRKRSITIQTITTHNIIIPQGTPWGGMQISMSR